MGLKITKASDYAVRAMIHLACLPEGQVAMCQGIAEAQGIPSSFMAKVLRNLVRARLLHSARGVNGGFGLARPAAGITLLDVIEAIEGPVSLVDCLSEDGCPRTGECPAVPTWRRVQESVRGILGEATLESLVSLRRRNGRIAEPTRLAIGSCHEVQAGLSDPCASRWTTSSERGY